MKSINTWLMGAGMALLTFTVNAQDLPKPSPAASFSQTVGVTNISMKYSRPSVKGRTIWGELVPYGKMWRAGANSSTKIEFGTEVMINGVSVPAGEYALFVMPSKEEWTFVISNHITGNGTSGYTEESDVVRVSVKPEEHAMVENLMFSMDQINDESARVSLSWERLSASFEVTINTKEFAGKNVEMMVKKADNSFSTYNDAAKWYMSTGDNAKALEMAQKSVSQNKRFWNLTVLSEAYMASGDKKMAIETAKEAIKMSEKAEYMPYVKRNTENIEKWDTAK